MEQVQIQRVCTEATEAAFASCDGAVTRRVAWQHLADEEDILAAAGNCLTDKFFGSSITVHLSRVDQAHAEIEASAQGGNLVRTASCGFSQIPRALPQSRKSIPRGKFGIGNGFSCCFHGDSLAFGPSLMTPIKHSSSSFLFLLSLR